ncbi:hypothetical protein M079_1244 [Bacteroides fragilis str. 3996 N(B) 6]|uniref:Uncharacterized protein n=1 Tax=Bacteroides fragilis str. 3998T(B)3 TaxID=1339316 RepID=A0A015TT02_BACFG|nr:hypothetical protein M079_1244 [Bacteroides fragilis str. 3996 N(B) 6]EXY87559.1 hypothetical protein M125_5828 [Bacteroides fragilis str. 3998T(B)3]EXY96596.1 hypothetical protein M081_1247 [Bacteroides fragilis str. 3998 T(B) 4]
MWNKGNYIYLNDVNINIIALVLMNISQKQLSLQQPSEAKHCG